jgi:hypothetical protein
MLSSLPHAADLLSVARRCVWFLSPDEALDRPVHFIAQVLTYGVHDDVRMLRRYVSDRELIAALDQAPPGVFDGRSWAYWHLKLKGLRQPPPMPERVLPDVGQLAPRPVTGS